MKTEKTSSTAKLVFENLKYIIRVLFWMPGSGFRKIIGHDILTRKDRYIIGLWIFAIIGDGITTWVALRIVPDAIEANPIPALIFSGLGSTLGIVLLIPYCLLFMFMQISAGAKENSEIRIFHFALWVVLIFKLTCVFSNAYILIQKQ